MRHYNRCCIIFVGIVLQAYRIHGQLTINMPADNVGNYQETTHLNCTESTFDIAKGYVWYKDGSVIYDSAVPSTGKYKSSHGSTYFTLEITNTALNDNGTYRCNYNFVDVSDTLEIQAKGIGVGKLENGDLTITLTRFYPASTTVSSVVCNAKTFTGTLTITADGDLFTIVWTSKNIDSNDVKEGCDVNIQSRTTYVIRVDVESATTSTATTPTTTTTSSSASTSTTSTSKSKTPTSASTTSTQTSIASSLMSASTTHIIHTTFEISRVSSTKPSTSSTKIEKPLTTLPSVDSSSSGTVVIIAASVVGGLFIIGIVTTLILMLLSQQKRRKHVSKGIHTHEDNRNTWKFQRSKSPSSRGHSNHGYLFNGLSTGHQFKQNPLFRRQYNRPVTYKYQPRHGNYSQSPYSLRYIYPGFTDGDQYSSRYAGQDRRVNEAPNYHNSGSLRPHYYSHPPHPQRSNSRMPVRETLHTDGQNYVVSDYSVYW